MLMMDNALEALWITLVGDTKGLLNGEGFSKGSGSQENMNLDRRGHFGERPFSYPTLPGLLGPVQFSYFMDNFVPCSISFGSS